jgi:hypothetical protein
MSYVSLGYGLDNRRIMVWFPVGTGNFLFSNVGLHKPHSPTALFCPDKSAEASSCLFNATLTTHTYIF